MKILVALFAFVAISATVFAQTYTGPSQSASASFDCKVITALTWDAMTAVNLTGNEVVANDTRNWTAIPITFTLNGEIAATPYGVTVTTSGPTAPPTQTTVTLLGTWGANPSVLDAAGKATVSFSCTGVKSTATTDNGTYSFTLGVNAFYTSL